MSEITFKDARYYDLITKEQLAVGHVVLLTFKDQPAGVMTPAVEWAKSQSGKCFHYLRHDQRFGIHCR
jgi:hypothetical protein